MSGTPVSRYWDTTHSDVWHCSLQPSNRTHPVQAKTDSTGDSGWLLLQLGGAARVRTRYILFLSFFLSLSLNYSKRRWQQGPPLIISVSYYILVSYIVCLCSASNKDQWLVLNPSLDARRILRSFLLGCWYMLPFIKNWSSKWLLEKERFHTPVSQCGSPNPLSNDNKRWVNETNKKLTVYGLCWIPKHLLNWRNRLKSSTEDMIRS